MKKKILTSLFFTLSCCTFISAQDQTSHTHAIAVKWAPAAIYFGKISLGSEYSLDTKSSVTLNVGIPFDKTWRHEINGEDESLTHHTLSLMGGYRRYLGRGDGHGLYIEPYLKYLKYEASSIVDAELQGTTRNFSVEGNYNGVGIGAQLGAQFLIADKFVIDFYFLGPEANISKTKVFMQELGNGLPWDPLEANEAEDEIRDVLDDIPIVKNKAEVSVNASQRNMTASYKGFLPGYRIGVSVGWRF
jgi:hypothetical protein